MQRSAVWALAALLLALCTASVEARRQLTQDALSNSNGCLATIPKCEQGACATRNIMGVARWTCLRCLSNYEPVVDASGQDNIIQCVCPKGFYEPSAGAGACVRCPANTYCPGGDKVENPTSRGSNMTCGANLVTRNTGARSQSDCLAPAGYARTSPTTATACAKSEYAPQYNRLSKCLRCQSGLEEPSSSGLTDGQRSSKRAVCKIPPGKYVSQGLVRICPQGFYRENWVDFDAAIGTLCLPCKPGITTNGAGAGLASLCNVVLPGYGISEVTNVTGPSSIPALPSSEPNGLPNATICDIGFYSMGGYCAQCPAGTVTRVKGAKSIEECMVPPGYYLTPNMVTCGSGTFREGWLMASDPKATTCTPCGDGIQSEPRDLDENPLVANGTLVRATSTSCFIEAGQGMIAQGKNLFVGKDCPANTYGAAGKVYGWASAPCKPCPRNMITDNLTKVNNSDVCINDDGFGYASEGASRCAPGFYSAKGSRKPCQQCPVGRTTADDPKQQRYITECLVKPGFGVVNSTSNGTDAFNPDTNVTPDQQANMPVLECPVGYYSTGGDAATKCQQCPAGSSTQESGSTNSTACSVCVAGYGKAAGSDVCTLCPYGTYQPGGLTECQACPQTPFYSPVDGNGTTYVSSGTTTYPGSFGIEACVPQQSQLSPEAGQAYFSPDASSLQSLLTSSTQNSLGDCVATCPAGSCCMAQYDVTGKTCKTISLDPQASDASTNMQVVYKLPPSTLGSASSVKQATRAKMISSGYYAHCSIPSSDVAKWQTAGSDLAIAIIAIELQCSLGEGLA